MSFIWFLSSALRVLIAFKIEYKHSALRTLPSIQRKILNRKDKGVFILKHYNFMMKALLWKDKGLNTSEVSHVPVRAILI